MTIQDLRIAIAALPDDMEVFVNGAEIGLIAPKSIDVVSVVTMNEEWVKYYAPMMGTHMSMANRPPRDIVSDSPPFRALVIERQD